MRILLLDAHNLFHRSRHGFDSGVDRVTYNFFNSFKSLLFRFKPDLVYLVLEGEPKKNKELLPEYKADREPSPDDFVIQCRQIKTLLMMTPVIQVRHPDFECDDVLYTIAVDKHPNDDIVIVSTDSDFIQVLRQHRNISLWNPVKKIFVAKPDYDYVIWKALRGDKTDNVPSVRRGLNDEKAFEIIQTPGMLELLREEPQFEEKFQRNLSLIKLDRVPLSECEFTPGQPDFDQLRCKLRELKFEAFTRDKPWSKFTTYLTK